MRDISTIKREWLDTQMEALKVKGISKAEISRQLEMSPQQLNNVLNGSRGITDSFIDKFVAVFNISQSDLFYSDGATGEKGKIPLYDVTTIGGTNEMIALQNGVSHVAEWIDAGDWFPEATSAIHHYGTSMIEYPNGCILALKRVNDQSLIINGRNYVIETDEYRITKQLQDGGDCIIAHSTNRETYPDGSLIHAPMRIPKAAVRHLDLVLGCVTKEYSNGAIPIYKTR